MEKDLERMLTFGEKLHAKVLDDAARVERFMGFQGCIFGMLITFSPVWPPFTLFAAVFFFVSIFLLRQMKRRAAPNFRALEKIVGVLESVMPNLQADLSFLERTELRIRCDRLRGVYR